MNLLTYSARNVMRIRDVNFDLQGHHLYLIGGKNGQGKTSSIKSLAALLCGRSGMDDYPPIMLRDGEDEGWVRVEMTGDEELHTTRLTVELKLRRKRGGQVVEELRVLDSEGEEAPEPRTLLKRLIGLRAFDPLAFEKLSPKEQKATLERLLGLDFSAERAEWKELYDERTAINRDLKAAQVEFEKCPSHADAPESEVDTAALMAELERRQKINGQQEIERKRLEQIDREIAQNLGKIASIQEQVKRLLAEVDDLKAADASLVAEREQADINVSRMKPEDECAIRDQIKNAGSLNRKVQENRRKAEAKARLGTLEAQSKALTERLDAIEAAQKKRMQEAEWPVEGLSLDKEGVLYNGLPFEQACRSLRLKTSVKIGMALNPKLKLLVCEHGGDLDEDALAELDAIAKAEGFQILLELVTRTPQDEARCAVIIRDGNSA